MIKRISLLILGFIHCVAQVDIVSYQREAHHDSVYLMLYQNQKELFIGDGHYSLMHIIRSCFEGINTTWCAQDKDKAIGFINYYNSCNEGLCVRFIVVDKEYRRKKIATRLMEKAFNHCKQKKISQVILNVSKKNTEAISFYKSCEFKEEESYTEYMRFKRAIPLLNE